MIDDKESVTAKLCSFARAYHSNFEKDKIFDDYLAFDLMGKDEYEEIGQLIEHDYDASQFDPSHTLVSDSIREKLNRYITPIPISRAAFTEHEIERFAWDRGECQYVICGAGMDTYAFRNIYPNIRIFEIDHPDTQHYKLEKIGKLEWIIPSNVHFVPVDFSKDDMGEKLIAAGYDPKLPSFFAILGVTYYLTLPIFEETLKRIGELSSFASKLVFDFPDETTLRDDAPERVRTLAKITEGLGEKMEHGYSVSEVYKALSRQGFLVDDHMTPEALQKRYFDGRTDGERAYENIHLILAKKGDVFNESYYLYI